MKRYADDYEIQMEKDERGREKKVAVYRGNFYEVNLDEKQLIQLRKNGILFFLIIFILHVAGGFAANPGMYAFYVALPYVVAFLPFYFLGSSILRIPKRKRLYHREEVELSFTRARKASLSLLILLGIVLLGEIIFLIWFSGDGMGLDLIFLGTIMLTTVPAFLLFRRLKTIQVTQSDDSDSE